MTGTTPSPHSEIALEQDLPIVDPHHHLWRTPPITYGRQEPYLMDHLVADTTAGHNVTATCFVECSSSYRTSGPEALRPVGETEWVLAQHRRGRDKMAGILARGDLQLGSRIAEILEAHAAAAGPMFKGVRTRATWDRDPAIPDAGARDLLTSAEASAALGELRKRALVFDVWVYFHQLDDVRKLAAAHPDVPIVVDHLASPLAVGNSYAGRRSEVLTTWRAGLLRLARHPNVYIKLGGLGIQQVVDPVLPNRQSSADLAAFWGPEIRFCIDAFSPQRCMFESNYPIDSYVCDYVTLWNVFKRVTADLSITERTALFHTTAADVYGLDGTTSDDRKTFA